TNQDGLGLQVSGPGGFSSLSLPDGLSSGKLDITRVRIAADTAKAIDLAFYANTSFHVARVWPSDANSLVQTLVKKGLHPNADLYGPLSIGNGTGLATRGNLLFVSHVDNSTGVSHIAYRRMELPPLE